MAPRAAPAACAQGSVQGRSPQCCTIGLDALVRADVPMPAHLSCRFCPNLFSYMSSRSLCICIAAAAVRLIAHQITDDACCSCHTLRQPWTSGAQDPGEGDYEAEEQQLASITVHGLNMGMI